LPGIIAQEIVGVQPMTLPKDLAILSSSMLVFKRTVINSDGVRFKFHPIIGKDGVVQILGIKVWYFLKEVPGEEFDIGQMMVNIDDFTDTQANSFIEKAIEVLIERIDDLTIDENFNLKAGLKLLEEAKLDFECAEKQENNTTSPQSSTINVEEFSV